MLKVIPNNGWSSVKNKKCGEIYCQDEEYFSIVCAICALKTFSYNDFLQHFQNLHLQSDVQTDEIAMEVTSFLQSNFKVEADVLESDEALEFTAVTADDDAVLTDEDEKEMELRLIKWEDNDTKPDILSGDGAGTGIVQDDYYDDDNDDDADYKPPRKQQRKPKKETKDFKCDVCQKVYKSAQNLSVHLKKGHESTKADAETKLKCEECDAEFQKLRHLEEHCVTEHGGMKCAFCDRKCSSRTNLQRHTEMHTHGNEKTFQCDIDGCTKCFFTRRQCLAHRRTHTKGKNYVCDVCGYCCREPETLKVHYRTHTGEKPFACKECGKCFVSTSAVKEHSASHIKDRPHVCKVCGHTFARAKSLYHHSFLHLAEKKFKCKVCGNAYAQLAGLAGHMRKHKEEGFY